MCGIAAIVTKDGEKVGPALHTMTCVMCRRGPDGNEGRSVFVMHFEPSGGFAA